MSETAAPDSFDPRQLLAETTLGILATIKASGMPQLSPVSQFYYRDTDTVEVSITADRAKGRNLARDPRAAIEVTGPDGYSWATAEGPVTLHGPAESADDPAVEALVDYYRKASGEHPDWDEYRQVMVDERRVLMVMQVARVYGRKLR
ncbi:PPOX class F420-dependent oxidoreductase [Naumannella halotolerans]|uniref:PPOX class probable F420-dependent enzyme n=1 Tax=Naumannella halotolerans TaxID=993414 RepID=A0A4R7JBV1_9ACTN|nr:PPOX class F420-dependent oxidoreductase [Naumannella halotolerans]TDT34157.1 PPOX class probable F420-dependent enzyme [Naumannella halotolerans]